jgi:hypothetical protein
MNHTRRSCLLLLVFCLPGVPVSAQVNLSGVWNNLNLMHEDWPDRWTGPEIGDYAGVPLNDAARLRADTWDASLITLPECQCRVHPADYVPSFGGMRIWEERDSASQQLIAIHAGDLGGADRSHRVLGVHRQQGLAFPHGQGCNQATCRRTACRTVTR